MSLESEISSVLSNSSVVRVVFTEETDKVRVLYSRSEFFSEWPHGDDAGSHEQQESYYQDQFGVDWSFVEIDTDVNYVGDTQVAVFER